MASHPLHCLTFTSGHSTSKLTEGGGTNRTTRYDAIQAEKQGFVAVIPLADTLWHQGVHGGDVKSYADPLGFLHRAIKTRRLFMNELAKVLHLVCCASCGLRPVHAAGRARAAGRAKAGPTARSWEIRPENTAAGNSFGPLDPPARQDTF